MIPTQAVLSIQILDLIDSQKKLKPSDNPEKSFADGLAKIVHDAISSASVIGVAVTVSGTSATGGPVVGTGTQNNQGTLQ